MLTLASSFVELCHKIKMVDQRLNNDLYSLLCLLLWSLEWKNRFDYTCICTALKLLTVKWYFLEECIKIFVGCSNNWSRNQLVNDHILGESIFEQSHFAQFWSLAPFIFHFDFSRAQFQFSFLKEVEQKNLISTVQLSYGHTLNHETHVRTNQHVIVLIIHSLKIRVLFSLYTFLNSVGQSNLTGWGY